jgi:succinoglycan biosynthesis protein ExoO
MRSLHTKSLNASPDISFIVAAFNAAPFVETALRSALRQTEAEIEIIVVDDGSTDGTPEIVAAMAETDARITLLRRQGTSGPSVARNAAMAVARGTWMAILDADDEIAPERSRRLLDLAATTSADIVADNFERFWVDGEVSGVTMMPRTTPPYALLVDLAAFMRGNEMFHPMARFGYVKAMFRTEFVRANQILHREDIQIGEDYHLCLSCLLANARFIVSSESYYKYRTRRGSLSWRITKEQIDRLLKAHKDLKLQERYAGSTEILAAGQAYAAALEKAGALASLVDATKHGKWAEALQLIAGRPDLWRLVTRFGAAAVAKRLTLPRSGLSS